MSEIVYVYGFVPDAAQAPQALGGVTGAHVEVVRAAGVHAVVSYLPAAEFSPDVIDAQIGNLDWVGARGLEHERVVAWFVDHSEILPASLFTLFSSIEALQAHAIERAHAVHEALARLNGHREWDLKVTWDRNELATHAADIMDSVKSLDAEIAQAAAGRRFLLEKKRADVVKNELSAAARMRARDMLEQIAAHATDVIALPLPRTAELPVILNAALLVRRSSEGALADAAGREAATLKQIGIHARLTGPWAPYRFMEPRDAAAR
ncbi:MAG TPA: GvpL/GvpF family gas vesicle protein [Longimicrobiales bacterium]